MMERITNLQRQDQTGEEPRTDPYKITKMPDQETLEDFLRGMCGGKVNVVYRLDLGRFERLEASQQSDKPEEGNKLVE